MVAFLSLITSITKPELFYWQLCLVSEETTVLTPVIVILITITTISGVGTWVGHPACALTTARWCSAPVRHLSRITWHPPSIWIVKPKTGAITLILDKLFTVRRNSGKSRQLRQFSSCVMNVTRVTPRLFTTSHQLPSFIVMTDDCYANTFLVSHVTVDSKRCQTPVTIWINDILPADCADGTPDFRAGSRRWMATVMSISNVPRLALAWVRPRFIHTCSKRVTVVCLFFTLIEI